MENKPDNDVFVSYNWKLKSKVRVLQQKLDSAMITTYLDEKNSNNNQKSLTTQSISVIKNSKIFLCCITHDYCESNNCNLEIEFAKALEKPIIALMFDDLNIKDINQIHINDTNITSDIGSII